MKRMTEEKAKQMLTFFAGKIDVNNLPLDYAATYCFHFIESTLYRIFDFRYGF